MKNVEKHILSNNTSCIYWKILTKHMNIDENCRNYHQCFFIDAMNDWCVLFYSQIAKSVQANDAKHLLQILSTGMIQIWNRICFFKFDIDR